MSVAADYTAPTSVAAPTPPWAGETPEDLHAEHGRIFKHGNRNAASHLWSTFLLDRAPKTSAERLVRLFGGFCGELGCPVGASDYNRYRLNLDLVRGGGKRSGFMHYCC